MVCFVQEPGEPAVRLDGEHLSLRAGSCGGGEGEDPDVCPDVHTVFPGRTNSLAKFRRSVLNAESPGFRYFNAASGDTTTRIRPKSRGSFRAKERPRLNRSMVRLIEMMFRIRESE